MSEPTKFDVSLAMINLAKAQDAVDSLTLQLDHANTDLADLREQLAQMTRQRDEALRDLGCVEEKAHEYRAQLAEAKRKVAGAVYSFAAHLTSLKNAYSVGAMHDASRMVQEVSEWAERFGVSLDDPIFPAPSPAAAPEVKAQVGSVGHPTIGTSATPAPTREPERTPWQLPVFTETHGELSHQYVEITPEAAAALLRLAAQHGEGV